MVICQRCNPNDTAATDTVIVVKLDTITITDTLVVRYPQPYMVRVTDTLHITDTIMVREQKTYRDTSYTAWVSGYAPSLDSIRLYHKTTIVRKDIIHYMPTPSKSKPFGLGLQVGYGHPEGAYIGIGVSYNLLKW